MQVWLPMRVLFEIVGRTFRKQNVSGIAAVHHALRDVDTGARHVRHLVDVNDPADGAAVYAHPQVKLRVFLESPAYLQGAFDWRLRTAVKNQRHAVTGWDSNQPAGRFLALEFICAMDDLVEHVEQGSLLVNQQLGLPYDVRAKDMSDLQLDFFFNFGSHVSLQFRV